MNRRLHEFCSYSVKGLGKARDERVASAFAVILALQGSIAPSRWRNLEGPVPEVPAISGTGALVVQIWV